VPSHRCAVPSGICRGRGARDDRPGIAKRASVCRDFDRISNRCGTFRVRPSKMRCRQSHRRNASRRTVPDNRTRIPIRCPIAQPAPGKAVWGDPRTAGRQLSLKSHGVRIPIGAHFFEHSLRILAPLECGYPPAKMRKFASQGPLGGFRSIDGQKPVVYDLPAAPAEDLAYSDLAYRAARKTRPALRNSVIAVRLSRTRGTANLKSLLWRTCTNEGGATAPFSGLHVPILRVGLTA
jgi:hypothetical protein